MINKEKCACGSGIAFSKCCEPYCDILNINYNSYTDETSLFGWLTRYSLPISTTFINKAKSYIFRISVYFDHVLDQYFAKGFPKTISNQKDADDIFIAIKNNLLNTLIASLSCLSQCLFLQSGTLLSSFFEGSLVLIDIYENPTQFNKMKNGKYSTNNLITRVKENIPNDIVIWYGHFSANMVHFGPLHLAPHVPSACYPDNFVLSNGLIDIIRAVVTFHIVLERIYFTQTEKPLFWKLSSDLKVLEYIEDSKVFSWTERLRQELGAEFPPSERKEGFIYSEKNYTLK